MSGGDMDLRVLADQLRARGRERGWDNDAKLAKALGVPRGTLSRYLSGVMQPGKRFLAGVMFRAFPDLDPREFVAPVEQEADAPVPTGPDDDEPAPEPPA